MTFNSTIEYEIDEKKRILFDTGHDKPVTGQERFKIIKMNLNMIHIVD